MATYVPAKKNTQLIFYTGLVQQASTLLLKANPTLAAGDFKVSTDGGSLANLGTLPTVTPAAGVMIKVTLAAGEMNGDNATFVASDQAGAEWCDQLQNFQTTVRQIDDLSYPATSGRSMVVDAAGLVDANSVKMGPTGAGTALTARDIGASVLLSTGTGTGQLDFTSGVVKANLAQILGTALTETAGQIAAAFKQFFNIATPAATMDHGVLVDTVTTYTGNTKQTGDNYPRIGAPVGASISADLAAVKSDTGTILTDVNSGAGAIYARIGAPAGASIAADIAAVEANAVAIKAKTDPLPASPAATSDVTSLVTNALVESYAADGVDASLTQLLYELRALLGEYSISGAAITLHKKDGVTAAAIYTVDNAANPKAITRTG